MIEEKIHIPDAEDAKVTQKKYKKLQEIQLSQTDALIFSKLI